MCTFFNFFNLCLLQWERHNTTFRQGETERTEPWQKAHCALQVELEVSSTWAVYDVCKITRGENCGGGMIFIGACEVFNACLWLCSPVVCESCCSMASNVPLVAAWDSNVFAHLGFRLTRGEIFVEMIFACEIVCRVIILEPQFIILERQFIVLEPQAGWQNRSKDDDDFIIFRLKLAEMCTYLLLIFFLCFAQLQLHFCIFNHEFLVWLRMYRSLKYTQNHCIIVIKRKHRNTSANTMPPL